MTDDVGNTKAPRALSLCILALTGALAACGGENRDPAPVVYRGTDPATRETPLRPGVVKRDGYNVVIAQSGDTIESLATRAGVSPSSLAAYNGLPATHGPRAGDELVIPPAVGGRRPETTTGSTGQPGQPVAVGSLSPVEARPLDDTSGAAPSLAADPVQTGETDLATAGEPVFRSAPADDATSRTTEGGFSVARVEDAIARSEGGRQPGTDGSTLDQQASINSGAPVFRRATDEPSQTVAAGAAQSHVVREGETFAEIAGVYGVTGDDLAIYNQRSANETPVPGETLLIPSAPARSPLPTFGQTTAPGTGSTDLTAPPSSVDPLPAPETTPRALDSPNLGEFRTTDSDGNQIVEEAEPTELAVLTETPQSTATGQFLRPVDGPIIRKFSRVSGAQRNDGVDFAVPAGSTVVSAETGTVALVSKSLGGLGTIVLVRHDNGWMTVYGRVGAVSITKGQVVERGQEIGTVAEVESPREPSLHFEIRRGAESVDPEAYF